MTKSQIAAERALEIWQFMQDELVRVVGLLSDTQMNTRIAPNLRTLGEQAEHIVRGRALWVHKVVDDPSLEPMMNWDEPDDPTRSAAEVVAGLQHTWQILRAYIEPSTTDDPACPAQCRSRRRTACAPSGVCSTTTCAMLGSLPSCWAFSALKHLSFSACDYSAGKGEKS